jgi:exonuclease III
MYVPYVFQIGSFLTLAMKVKIITHNVQGLNNPVAVNRLKNYYFPLLRDVDVLCLQEHKLREQNLLDLGQVLWPQATCFGCEATVGNQVEAGRGGLYMLISPKIRHLIHSQGVIGANLAQWVVLKGLPRGDVAIANVYAPNSAHDRMTLWQEMVRCLPLNCRWVVGGDWNVVENGRDKSSREGRIISNAESFELELLKAHLQVQDYFKYDNFLTYSWDNHRADNNRVLARLDRFYIFPNRNEAEDHHILEYNIRGDCGISDHLPVSCIIELLQEKVGGSKYKVNGTYLTDPRVVAELEKLWKESPATTGFFGKMKRILKWYKEMCLTKARQRRAQEKKLRDRLVFAQAALQHDPVNTSYQATVEEILDELRSFKDWKTAGIRTRSALRKRATGNKATKEFY